MALAAILLQKQKTDQWAPVAYYSQSTNDAESRYHSFELEMLAVVKLIERFHIYLYGIQFTVIINCHALVYAINKAHLSPRIARWTLRLQSYSFTVFHRPGTKIAHVDALSRVVASISPFFLRILCELEFRQLKDSVIKGIALDLETSENVKSNEKFEFIDGLVFKRGQTNLDFTFPNQWLII